MCSADTRLAEDQATDESDGEQDAQLDPQGPRPFGQVSSTLCTQNIDRCGKILNRRIDIYD